MLSWEEILTMARSMQDFAIESWRDVIWSSCSMEQIEELPRFRQWDEEGRTQRAAAGHLSREQIIADLEDDGYFTDEAERFVLLCTLILLQEPEAFERAMAGCKPGFKFIPVENQTAPGLYLYPTYHVSFEKVDQTH